MKAKQKWTYISTAWGPVQVRRRAVSEPRRSRRLRGEYVPSEPKPRKAKTPEEERAWLDRKRREETLEQAAKILAFGCIAVIGCLFVSSLFPPL